MEKIENHCVECTSYGLHCIGESCEKRRVKVSYCDSCKWHEADYMIGKEEYCHECAEEILMEAFKELSLHEKASLLDVTIEDIE